MCLRIPGRRAVYTLIGMQKIRVIIADDHAIVREGTRHILEQEEDLEVDGEARDGAEAVSLVDATNPDVAILDISMPTMGGIEATDRLDLIRVMPAEAMA